MDRRRGLALGCALVLLAAVSSLAAAPARADLLDALPDGPRKREALERRAERERQRAEADAELDARIEDADEKARDVQERLEEESAEDIAAAGERVDDYARAHPVEGLTPIVVESSSVAYDFETGTYSLEWDFELQYRDGFGNTHWRATFDQAGNVVEPLALTPWGRATEEVARSLEGRLDEDDSKQIAWNFDRDADDNVYPSDFIIQVDGRTRGLLRFNESGKAWFRDLFDEDGQRVHRSISPESEQPVYGDPGPPLASVVPPRPGTGPCPDCRDELEARNDVVREMGELAARINELAGVHGRVNKEAREREFADGDLFEWREEHEGLLERYRALEARYPSLHAAWIACEEACAEAVQAAETAAALASDVTAAAVGAEVAQAVATAGAGLAVSVVQDSAAPCTHGGTRTLVPVGPLVGPGAVADPGAGSPGAPAGIDFPGSTSTTTPPGTGAPTPAGPASGPAATAGPGTALIVADDDAPAVNMSSDVGVWIDGPASQTIDVPTGVATTTSPTAGGPVPSVVPGLPAITPGCLDGVAQAHAADADLAAAEAGLDHLAGPDGTPLPDVDLGPLRTALTTAQGALDRAFDAALACGAWAPSFGDALPPGAFTGAPGSLPQTSASSTMPVATVPAAPPQVPTIYLEIDVKATTEAIETGAGAQDALLPKQHAAIEPGLLADFGLPTDDCASPPCDAWKEDEAPSDLDAGSQFGPLECLVDAGGSCTFEVPLAQLQAGRYFTGVGSDAPAGGASPGATGATPDLSLIDLLGGEGGLHSISLLPWAGSSASVLYFPGGDASGLAASLEPWVHDPLALSGGLYVPLLYPRTAAAAVQTAIAASSGVTSAKLDPCGTVFRSPTDGAPDDPLFHSSGSWGQGYADQWALHRIGLDAGPESAWRLVGPRPEPVVVAVIDTGLDWNHRDFSWRNLWFNEDEVPDNGVDDDGNGYVDDRIGWDFWNADPHPFDDDGHGTVTAGIIAAASDNGVGMAGVDPNARIMVLKAMNGFGHTRMSFVAAALVYAVDNGARVVNLSLGSNGVSDVLAAALDYAAEHDVLVVAAAGNDGAPVEGVVPASHPSVLTVGSTDADDRPAVFSNFGPAIDLVAPGVDVLSLRARFTDTLVGIEGVAYTPRDAWVGADTRYYRIGGTSFSAPLVAGVASLRLSREPGLAAADLRRILRHTAVDVGEPGLDPRTGHGRLDARAALRVRPGYLLEARIASLAGESGPEGSVLAVRGTARADDFAGAEIEIAPGERGGAWQRVAEVAAPVENGLLARIPAARFRGHGVWTLRLVAHHADGSRREARFVLDLE